MPLEEIRGERIKKMEILRGQGINAYPAQTRRSHVIKEVLQRFSAFTKKKLSLAGRILAKREHGGSTFLDLADGSGKIQVYLKKDILGDAYDLALEALDIGDFIGVDGTPFKTQKGEPTIEADGWTTLAKSLRPLPEKWHGLQDVEERFRKRYLDLLMNEEARGRFGARSLIIAAVREFHEKNGFLEVETPMLHPLPGGALAKPFVTHHNALDTDFYLRIAPELYLKRLLIGGMERVFEIGKCFRNEGIDVTHNPEFTMLESYASYWSEEEMMKFVEALFTALVKKFGPPVQAGKKSEIEHEDLPAQAGKKIKFKAPFSRVTFKDLLSRYAQITDYERETRDSLVTRARQLGIETEKSDAKGKIADEIYKKVCRPYLVQPTFVTNHPVDISPLAKGAEKTGEVRRFQLIAGGMELTNGFAELNDPLDQRERFAEQEKMRLPSQVLDGKTWEGKGDEEAHRIDEDYLEALEYGMPPAAGLGIGIDRVVMLFTNTKNIREVVLFPTMRPK